MSLLVDAIKHLAADKASSFRYVLEYLVDMEVLRHDAPTAVSEMEAVKDGIRFGLDTTTFEVINSPNFYNHQAVYATRTEQWYTVNQDNKLPELAGVDAEGNRTNLLTEAELCKLCDMMYTFARQVDSGLHTYYKDATSPPGSDKQLNIHEIALMLRSMPKGMDHPLAYAVNCFQAFTVCLHVIYSDYYTADNVVVLEFETTVQAFLEHHVDAVMKLQREGGFQLPLPFRQHAWNQLAVVSGYTYDCMKKKTAISNWEEEFKNMTTPSPLLDDDGLFPPKLQGHPKWDYDTGRVATPWASDLEADLRPPNQGMTPEHERASTSMPKATPSRGPKRARTDESRSTSASSSSRPPPPPQPEDEPVRALWMEVPIPEGAQEYSYRFFKSDNPVFFSFADDNQGHEPAQH